MIDEKNMRVMLEKMESAAEEALSNSPAFHEALQSLKAEIDRDPRVQSAMNRLRASGGNVFSSLVPHIRIRVRTSEGVVALSTNDLMPTRPAGEPMAQLTQELRNAAAAVIMRGRYREELDHIMNEAVCASSRFEGIASEIENAGHEVVICLDLSAYAQIRGGSQGARDPGKSSSSLEPLSSLLSVQDLKFLKALKIKAFET